MWATGVSPSLFFMSVKKNCIKSEHPFNNRIITLLYKHMPCCVMIMRYLILCWLWNKAELSSLFHSYVFSENSHSNPFPVYCVYSPSAIHINLILIFLFSKKKYFFSNVFILFSIHPQIYLYFSLACWHPIQQCMHNTKDKMDRDWL